MLQTKKEALWGAAAPRPNAWLKGQRDAAELDADMELPLEQLAAEAGRQLAVKREQLLATNAVAAAAKKPTTSP